MSRQCLKILTQKDEFTWRIKGVGRLFNSRYAVAWYVVAQYVVAKC